jgi:hypothetical protein
MFACLSQERLRRRVFAIVGRHVLDLVRPNSHDVDGIADHVGGAALAFRAFWHCY